MSKNQPQITTEPITPAMAAAMLAKNPKNRNIRTARVRGLVRAMAEGHWRFNGAPIRIDWNGNLIDGQHRLSAIVECGIAQTLLIIRGLDPEVQKTIDRVSARRLADDFRMDKHHYPAELASSLRKVLGFEKKGRLGWSKMEDYDGHQALPTHPSIHDSAAYIMARYSSLKSMWGDKSFLVAFHYIFSQVDSTKANEFFARLADGINLGANHPVLKLRKKFEDIRDEDYRRRKKTTGEEKAFYVIRAWNMFYKDLNLAYFRTYKNYPKIEGYTYSLGGDPGIPSI